ncbi:MAG: TonB family protein [Bacteroidia bacterium]|nr:TonB family protein [Bacteroidia bacterium]
MKSQLVFFKSRSILIGCLLSFYFSSGIIKAQNEEMNDKTLSPYFVVISEHSETDELPLKETSAKINIVGVIADVTVKQVYVNSGKNTLEAVYTFPLSTKAAVYAMQMTIGKRIITAKIDEKEKARKDYEKAKSEGKRASLLEQSRPNVFTMNVANIVVNDTIIVELKYTELLIPENGIYSLVYPTVVGPRYSNKSKEKSNPDDYFVSTPYTRSGIMPTYKYDIYSEIHSGIPIQNVVCSTHKVIVSYPDLKSAVIKLDPAESDGGNRDFILNYSLQGDKIEAGLMLFEDEGENFFLMMVQPPKKILKSEIPPREYVFIVDVSGSMHGFPLDISKNLLRNLIMNLNPGDKFNVVLFSGSTGLLSDHSLDANLVNIDKAISFINSHSGGGGTELLPALKTAMSLPQSDPDMSRSFVIATDGFVNIEKDAFEYIRNNCGTSNFFSFGIGNSVNRYLIEGMAFMGNGEPIITSNQSSASAAADKFRNYINTPVLTRIKVDYGSFDVYDTEPASVPDMLAERPIIIFGKYKGKPEGMITLKGKTGHQSYKQVFNVPDVKPDPLNSAIKYLWARDRIKLLDYYTGGNANASSIVREITDLGLKYNLMTNYTSFIAIDEQVIKDPSGKLVRVKQPVPLPQGVSNYAVGYDSQGVYSANGQVGSIRGARSSGDVQYVVPVVEDELSEGTQVFTIVEEMPSFPGGEDSLRSFIKKSLKYPEEAIKKGISGTVFVSFVIEPDGSVGDVKVVRSVHELLDAEAVRIIKSLPRWTPGKDRGKAVSVSFTIPVKFSLS